MHAFSENFNSVALTFQILIFQMQTELCRSWEEFGSCRYGIKCQFAHSREELRPVNRHPKYKTEVSHLTSQQNLRLFQNFHQLTCIKYQFYRCAVPLLPLEPALTVLVADLFTNLPLLLSSASPLATPPEPATTEAMDTPLLEALSPTAPSLAHLQMLCYSLRWLVSSNRLKRSRHSSSNTPPTAATATSALCPLLPFPTTSSKAMASLPPMVCTVPPPLALCLA
jgi:butyrate response factor 1